MSTSFPIISPHCNMDSHRQMSLGQVWFWYQHCEVFQLLCLVQRPYLLAPSFAEPLCHALNLCPSQSLAQRGD